MISRQFADLVQLIDAATRAVVKPETNVREIAQTQLKEDSMRNARVIDADGHVLDRDADIRAFIEEPYCRRQGSLLPKDKWDASMYGKLGMNITDVPTRLRDMDKEGIEVSVLFPTSGFAVTQIAEKDYAAAFCRGYNEWIASVCKESLRLKGIGLVPFQDVSAAVAEVNRAPV
jgi:predicted TIM-barrel fold metal-dependent hydrolase